MSPETVQRLVDNLFRHQWGQLVATLTRILGDFDLAEEVVQEALLKALRIWPYRGIPDNPRAWLVTAARNRALDQLRHFSIHQKKADELTQSLRLLADACPTPRLSELMADDQLKLLFLCCHPSLSPDSLLPLTLKLLGGLGNDEIARALLIQPSTAAQRIVRAKRRLRQQEPDFDLTPAKTRQRREAVLKVLYLMFNEGYAASGGDSLVRSDLCREALRLAILVADHAVAACAEADALVALMSLQSARLPQRLDAGGGLLLLQTQDRSEWDAESLKTGFERLEKATRGKRISEYHLQAAIAAEHASAPTFEATDWCRIALLYDDLLAMTGSPLVALNRAVAVAHSRGAASALPLLDSLGEAPELKDYYLLPATRARFLSAMGRRDEAAECFRRAIELPCNEAEKRFLRKCLAEAEGTVAGD